MKTTRRDFLKGAGAVVASASLGIPAAAEAATAPDQGSQDDETGRTKGKRPNILIILCDQMRFPTVYETDKLEAFRRQNLKTQELLRRNGLEFTRHYTAAAACAPSRTSILTGHYPSLHGVSQTYGGAKEACDPDVFWLDPNGVPTVGNYFREAGYRTFWKGKWHVSNAEMLVPGTHDPLTSYNPVTGVRDLEKEALYVAADRLGPYGFAGWVGPEAHGANPVKDTGSSAHTPSHGRDQGFAEQTVELIRQLDHDRSSRAPWLLVSSFVNPHDIGLFSQPLDDTGLYDWSVDDTVPADEDLFLPEYQASHTEDLSTKPKAQASYRDLYGVWGGSIPAEYGPHYRRLYYQLHKNVDQQMGKVMDALLASRFKDDTIVFFLADHGEMLGAHGDLHQKMYQAYEESTHVPLIVWSPKLFKKPQSVDALTSHIDLAPTLLGLAGIDPEPIRKRLAADHSDARPMVGRDLSQVILGHAGAGGLAEPVYTTVDDDAYRGLHMGDPANGDIGRPVVVSPKCIESVIAPLQGGILWRLCRYWDSEQYWSDPGMPGQDSEDILLEQAEATPDPEYDGAIGAKITVKGTPAPDEYELYDLTGDPMELHNRYGDPACAEQQAAMLGILTEQRMQKRLKPLSGPVPGQ